MQASLGSQWYIDSNGEVTQILIICESKHERLGAKIKCETERRLTCVLLHPWFECNVGQGY